VRISSPSGGAFIMARFEIAENDVQRLEYEIRERQAQIDHDVQLMRQVIMFIE